MFLKVLVPHPLYHKSRPYDFLRHHLYQRFNVNYIINRCEVTPMYRCMHFPKTLFAYRLNTNRYARGMTHIMSDIYMGVFIAWYAIGASVANDTHIWLEYHAYQTKGKFVSPIPMKRKMMSTWHCQCHQLLFQILFQQFFQLLQLTKDLRSKLIAHDIIIRGCDQLPPILSSV